MKNSTKISDEEERSYDLIPSYDPASVVAVVVTYNRKELLQGCLKALFAQSHPLKGIVLVDNASTDNTIEFLIDSSYITKYPSFENKKRWEEKNQIFPADLFFTYIRLYENEGGSGGFHEGLKRAMRENCDWFWILDDDVEPEKDCLENLLKFNSISKCIHPRKFLMDGTPLEWEGYLDIKTGQRVFLPDPSFKKGFNFSTTNTGCFEGMLVHREIVEKIGFPDKRFFIFGDDSIYGFLASFHTAVLYTKDAHIKKIKFPDKKNPMISNRSIYYGMRNRFLFLNLINKKVPKYRYSRLFFLFLKFLDYGSNIFHSRKNDRIRGYLILFRAVKDGLIGKFGKGI